MTSRSRLMASLLPMPGEDWKAWAQQLTAQLTLLVQQIDYEIRQPSTAATSSITPILTPDDTIVIDVNGHYIDGFGRVIVDSTGLHVYDLVGFQVINGPNVFINTEHLVDNAVETAKLALGAITEVTIADNAISAPKLRANSVVAGKIAANAIIANDGVIGNAAIADAQIANLNANKINAGDIAAERIEANIVQALNGKFATLSALAASLGVVQILAGGALFTQGVTSYANGTGLWTGEDAGAYKFRIGNPQGARLQWTGSSLEVYNASNQLTIASGDVDYEQIVNKSGFASISQITSANISTFIATAAIDTAYIANAAITSAKIGLAQVQTANIADLNVTTGKIASLAVTNAKIADLAVTNGKIQDLSVSTLKIQDEAVVIPRAVRIDTNNTFSGNGTWQTIITAPSISLIRSANLVVHVGVTASFSSGIGTTNLGLRLVRNGVVLHTVSTAFDEGSSGSLTLDTTFVHSVGAGTYTYSVQALKQFGNGTAGTAVAGRFIVCLGAQA